MVEASTESTQDVGDEDSQVVEVSTESTQEWCS